MTWSLAQVWDPQKRDLLISLLVPNFNMKCVCVCVCVCVCAAHAQLLSRSVVFDSLQPMDCSLPVSSVHGILQARRLEYVAISSSRGSSHPRDPTCASCLSPVLAGEFFYHWVTWEASLIWRHHMKSIWRYCIHPVSSLATKWSAFSVFHYSDS